MDFNNNTQTERPFTNEDKKKNILYTLISAVIFFVLYFGFKGVSSYIAREYYITADLTSISDEQEININKYTQIASGENVDISGIIYENIKTGRTITILYSGLESEDAFTVNNINYEYGDIVTDLRIEAFTGNGYKYGKEYVYGNSYVNIENPNCYCVIYERNGQFFAEYHSNVITSEIMAIINTGEKVYY